jgi:hypothetical protein
LKVDTPQQSAKGTKGGYRSMSYGINSQLNDIVFNYFNTIVLPYAAKICIIASSKKEV